MGKEKVLAGKYQNYPVVYDHIKNMAGEDIFFNTLSVREFKPYDLKDGTWEGFKVTAAEAINSGEVDQEQRYISVVWRDGDRSLLQVNIKTYNRLMETMFGHVPIEEKENDEVKKTVKKKSKSKSHKKMYIMILIITIIILKFFVFKNIELTTFFYKLF